VNSSLTRFNKKLADIYCILPVAWSCINADTTEHIICCVKQIWQLLTSNKLVPNLIPHVLLCWTFLSWCFKKMSKNIKKFIATLNEKQINVTKDLYYFCVCVSLLESEMFCVKQ
jgi:hypothetical protein